jgi:hypothetical protein
MMRNKNIYIKRVGDNREWRVLKEGDDAVLAEWVGPGTHYWPGHRYGLRWIKYSDIVQSEDVVEQDEQYPRHDGTLFGEGE